MRSALSTTPSDRTKLSNKRRPDPATLARHVPTRVACQRSSIRCTSSRKKVTDAGTFRFQKRLLYIANSLVDQHIGLEETDDGVWSIYFNTVLLATLDERDYIIRG